MYLNIFIHLYNIILLDLIFMNLNVHICFRLCIHLARMTVKKLDFRAIDKHISKYFSDVNFDYTLRRHTGMYF